MSRTGTKERFADGVGIDGVRVQKAIGEVVRRFNSARQGDIHTRQTKHTRVMGWNPMNVLSVGATSGHLWPWMTEHNLSPDDLSGNNDFKNPHRVKGIRNRNISWRRDTGVVGQDDPSTGIYSEHHWMVATWLMMYPWPVVLTRAYLSLRAGGNRVDPATGPSSTEVYPNPFEWGAAGRPPGYADGDSVDDWRFVIQVASPLDPQNREADAVVFNRFGVEAETFKVVPHGTPVGDSGTPDHYGLEPEPNKGAHAAGYPNTYTPVGQVDYRRGLVIDEDVDIPIPAGCPIRAFIVQPFYNESIVTSPWGNGNTHGHFLRQTYSMALTFAEDLA